MRPRWEDSATVDVPIRQGGLRLATFRGRPIPGFAGYFPMNGEEFDLRGRTPPRG